MNQSKKKGKKEHNRKEITSSALLIWYFSMCVQRWFLFFSFLLLHLHLFSFGLVPHLTTTSNSGCLSIYDSVDLPSSLLPLLCDCVWMYAWVCVLRMSAQMPNEFRNNQHENGRKTKIKPSGKKIFMVLFTNERDEWETERGRKKINKKKTNNNVKKLLNERIEAMPRDPNACPFYYCYFNK